MALTAKQRRAAGQCQWPMPSAYGTFTCRRVAPWLVRDPEGGDKVVCGIHRNVARLRGFTVVPHEEQS